MKYLKMFFFLVFVASFQNSVAQQIDKDWLLKAVNNYRTKGCSCGEKYYPPVKPLVWSDKLEKVAQKHSDDMHRKKFLSHQGSNGSQPGQRLDKVGYKWTAYAENVAVGQPDEATVMDSWIKSEGHCANIMNPYVTEMAVAVKGKYWTQIFATEQIQRKSK